MIRITRTDHMIHMKQKTNQPPGAINNENEAYLDGRSSTNLWRLLNDDNRRTQRRRRGGN